ncbi:MAG: hypothetical protein CVV24_12495 [Ignavibacteriae bacterium HGW-Ignavibacteriae-3]|nr:MAG: hypothetical protein CVV24_12495 [Ignavibacteriae bacterium HGW-Ignavibacteriae-3]
MSSREQKNYFSILKRYERKFENRELEDYKMLLKRHKDDEDLDKLSMQKLKDIYNKYHVNREKKNYDQFFNLPPQDNSEDHSS